MKTKNITSLGAFSLAEVLITLLIVSMLMVVLAPLITKNAIRSKNDGIVFSYSPDNNVAKDDLCFLTVPVYGAAGTVSETYVSTRKCSEYEFTVPTGVSKVNLTLVAGGGGGGGAAGGIVQETNIDLSGTGENSTSVKFFGHLIKNVKINALVGRGLSGTGGATLSAASAGLGGKSSSALIGLKIPEKYAKGINYIPTNSTLEDVATLINIETDNANIVVKNGVEHSNITYEVPFQQSTDPADEITQPLCFLGEAAANLVYDCGATKSNYFTGDLGSDNESALSKGSGTTTHLNDIVYGGEGGKIPQIPNGYGWGGKNSDYIVSVCNGSTSSQSCTTTDNPVYSKMTESTEAGAAYGSVTVTTETPGNVGGGGAGGSVVRIKNFPVTAGATYKIRVGKGGAGGRAGMTGTYGKATAGMAGESGTSTAIYDATGATEKLLYLVNGGAGGLKGELNTVGSTTVGETASARNRNFLYTSNATFMSGISTDEEIGGVLGATTITVAANLPSGAALGTILSYPFYKTVPFDYLNYLKSYSANKLYTDAGYGGHSAFNTGLKTCTPQEDYTVYCGVLPRLTGFGTYLYTGGLGGFSGLKSKAGCGGNYVGHNIVYKTGKVTDSNKLYTPDNVGGTGVLKGSGKFSVNDLYDNCTTETPDGQKASYVAPNPLTTKFGSAGAGGGGGGYNINQGAGKGGDGQDGYLMIDWRK